MKFFDNYESVINCNTIKVRELITCVCNSCNKEYKTTKDSVRKNKQINIDKILNTVDFNKYNVIINLIFKRK